MTKILQFGLTAGPLAFLAVVLLLKATAAPPEAADDSNSRMMLLAFGPVVVSLYAATAFMQRLMLSAPRLRAGLPDQDTPAGWVGSLLKRHRTLTIIRMALMETAATIGLVVVLLAVFGHSCNSSGWFPSGCTGLALRIADVESVRMQSGSPPPMPWAR